MKRTRILLLLLTVCMATALQAQVYNQVDEQGNITQRNEYGGNFNPNKRDSVKGKGNVEIPIGVRSWTVDRRFGDIIPAEVDTVPHLFQNTIYNTGIYGEYNSTGNNYTPRQHRVFIDRPFVGEFYFTEPYSYTTQEPDQFLFLNTLSPYTNVMYDNCGDKQHGEDHIRAKFGVNASKRLGFGFDLDYHYGLGYYANQNTSHFRASVFTYYLGDRYQMHLLFNNYHRKVAENGGIVDDELILHPESSDEQYSEDEIPTVLSQNWNRNDSRQLFLSHRYNFGFYRKVKMTDEEIKAREFAQKSAQQKKKNDKDKKASKGRNDGRVADEPAGRPDNAVIMGDEPAREKPSFENDSTRISIDSQAKLDSLNKAQAIQDSIDATMKREFIPVSSFIHTLDLNYHSRIYQAYDTPAGYYADTFYDTTDSNAYSGDSIYDATKHFSVRNTVALALLEGFNKYVKAGLKVFAAHEMRQYKMPDLTGDSTSYFMNKWVEHDVNIGGQLSKTQGKTLHFDLAAEIGVAGVNAGGVAVDFSTDLNFPLFGDTVQLAAKAFFYRVVPVFFLENYHSKHLWWSHSLEKETRTRIEGLFTYPKTNTRLRVAVEELQNHTYFAMSYNLDDQLNRKQLTGDVLQESGNINVLTAQLFQHFRVGVLNWENVVTYQHSSNDDVLPLPTLNVFSNLYLKFKIARVLSVELGGCVTYFTEYYAPDYLPLTGQFAIQTNESSRVELGGYPFVDVYANMHLKRARFFISMSHVNSGTGNKNQFLTPHYPVNNRVLRMGVSWNFFN